MWITCLIQWEKVVAVLRMYYRNLIKQYFLEDIISHDINKGKEGNRCMFLPAMFYKFRDIANF